MDEGDQPMFPGAFVGVDTGDAAALGRAFARAWVVADLAGSNLAGFIDRFTEAVKRQAEQQEIGQDVVTQVGTVFKEAALAEQRRLRDGGVPRAGRA